MGEASADQAVMRFLAGLRVGDLCSGTVVSTAGSEVSVMLDGCSARPLGVVAETLDFSWRRRRAEGEMDGRRITAEVVAVDLDRERVRLSTAATEYPELWTFLRRLRRGEILAGAVAAIERFGVFVTLDEGPDHPVFPGVGFITYPELSWRRFEAASEVVEVGQRVSCEFLQFDTWNGEARLSLRATRPDPFAVFADGITAGQPLCGRVTKLVPFGVFVEVADEVEGLVPLPELGVEPVSGPEGIVQIGDEVSVVVTDVDRERRKLTLSLRRA
ncbi:S1 RNA-binding domain-containing protein [Streptomyces scabiei]|uniref:S1 RNA-binding domain-containing protein n=1 Tax=Streptomyces scabiei TaxID=1930 RepID=UPI0007661297|nr:MULTISPECIES: S1 RNA-binding domain-containing protein [Streptomyces]MBP5863728.1 S1 RNA-binding domain-containing protein [Streptomyces sp. LBUM 1484]MBP5875757.1 S1 RNA-binding domain-containing protein [Streptomyces sp. LBUM 1477]MBP5883477.1 S1 RNA-binding domain-containing protein [Streptomyces sp. LBUM 1487]MBP5899506.1 S1 RNA-binding domain-containing protein [Streptomyces sp. LBUM 1488]MDW8472987.1 S1 RNA-binding domain-containing protein [Streptomyces scabiei]